MPTIKLTSREVERLPFATSGQILYWDSDLTGFGLRVSSRSKVYFCQRRIDGREVRITIGKHPILSLNEAKTMAHEKLLDMIKGVNPIEKRRSESVRAITLREALDDYLERDQYKPSTIKEYRYAILNKYGALADLPLQAISKDMIESVHMRLAKEVGSQSANKCTRELRAVLNFAIGKYEVCGQPVIAANPVDRISDTRKWFKAKQKTRHLKYHHLSGVLQGLDAYPNQIMADYIRFVLFTGCRRNEAAPLTWEFVNRANRSFIINDPKNHITIELPLTSYLMEIIERRYAERVNPFVFPSPRSQTGHITEPKKVTKRIGAEAGQEFAMHDLRRTYVTIAESLDISHYALKALVNHKMSSSDITSHYIQMSVDRLREPMQRITDFILTAGQ